MHRIFNILVHYEKFVWLILLIGVVVYFPTIFNGFVWDDYGFIVDNPEVHKIDLLTLFGPNHFNSGPFYRPIPAVYFAGVYSLFGANAFFFHALQVLLHIASTILLFVLFRGLFTKGISFFLALVFLVHPINVESVAFIGATQSELFFIPGIMALILAQKRELSQKRVFWIIGLLALSLFTKETGFLFFLLVVLYRFIFRLGEIKKLLYGGVLLIVFYFIARILFGGVTFGVSPEVPLSYLSLPERLLQIPAIIVYYLQIFIFPVYLSIFQNWIVSTTDINNFILPLLIISTFFVSLIFVTILLFNKSKRAAAIRVETIKDAKKQKLHVQDIAVSWINARGILFFLSWFIIGIGLILQIVPLDMTVADRWFYFPIVGLLGIIGVGLQLFLHANSYNKKVILFAAIVIISLLSVRTFIRNFDYKDNITLYAQDLKVQPDNYLLMLNYAYELYSAGRIEEATTYAKKSDEIYPTVSNLNNLASLYSTNKEYEQSLTTYDRAIDLLQTRYDPEEQKLHSSLYINKAKVLWNTNKKSEAVDFIRNVALKEFPQDATLYVTLAQAEADIGNKAEARKAAEKAYALDPDNAEARRVYFNME